jgi:hypothetical protein
MTVLGKVERGGAPTVPRPQDRNPHRIAPIAASIVGDRRHEASHPDHPLHLRNGRSEPEAVSRIMREARTVAALRTPNAVAGYDLVIDSRGNPVTERARTPTP